MDALRILVDEIALEGLDGITISSLWIRLENRNPKFPLNLDLATKEFLWKSLVCDSDLDFYALPKERGKLVLFDRFAEVDPETGIQEIRRANHNADSQEDIYPVSIIQDNEDGIQGSCQFFKERKNVTCQVRTADFKPCCVLEDAINKWGEKLVVVASQTVRFRTLIGSQGDPDLKLTDHSYCILERLGRARWQGEIQRDLHSRAFKTDAGKMHYLRKSLDKNGLITLQSHVVRLHNGSQQCSILLLLKRFHVDRRSKYDILMEKASNILATCPRNLGMMQKMREQLCVSERTFKRVYQYMMAAKLVQVVSVPLRELDPDAGPLKTKKGTDVMVRCVKLLKEYGKKEDEDEDENDEDDSSRKLPPAEGRVRERDTLMQAYEIVVSSGTKGISKTALRGRMNVGKLEARMMCRLLERNDMIKGFMEDEGRQRTTKYISKMYVEQSDLNRQFAKEKARSEQLRTGEKRDLSQVAVATSSSVQSTSQAHPGDKEEEPEQKQPPTKCSSSKKPAANAKRNLLKDLPSKTTKQTSLKQTKLDFTIKTSTPVKTLTPPRVRGSKMEEVAQNPDQSDVSMDATTSQSANVSMSFSSSGSTDNEAHVTIVEDIVSEKEPKPVKSKRIFKRIQGPHQTYRLLKRKNLIIETVRSVKLIDNLYTLQRLIMDEEKQDGVSTKCCKKSILRLIRSLSREGMLKMLCTTIIQDGISKKVEFVVHPSITPDDPLVKSAIEQIRFRISSSYTAVRANVPQANSEPGTNKENRGSDRTGSGEEEQGTRSSKMSKMKTDDKMGVKQLMDFRPSIVPGLGRSLGFQPKMLRLRLVHSYLWYLIYGHPIKRSLASSSSAVWVESGHDEESNPNAGNKSPNQDGSSTSKEKTGTSEPHPSGAEGGEDRIVTELGHDQDHVKVYVDELSWRRFIPPTPLHREFSHGWALTSDILLSLPLSIFVQIIQVSYQVDGLETFLNDPVKQHFLIRFLPGKMKKQLLYKRRYIFSFHESMQRLCYLGLLQFGPTEKFQDKDQVFVFLKKKATIVDTTSCEPHYNMAVSARPFEHRRYTFDTLQEVENYWFDLQCVCLNTPLGVTRGPHRKGSASDGKEDEADSSEVMEPERPADRYSRMAYALKGSSEVADDGSIPGDGKGAAGLDSSFFSHLKRNWIWTSYLLARQKKPGDSFDNSSTLRLNSLLTKHPLPRSVSGVNKVNSAMGSRFSVFAEEEVQVTVESSERNSRVAGGRKQRRRRQKKETVKQAKRKKKAEETPKKRSRQSFHDEADQIALKRMTRQRVSWTLQEDSLLMLCRVASHFLNRKRKPFVPWQVVRDLLHAQFEESLDKTSQSVGRRARYIMKNPQTYLNFKICLAEVYQDKSIVEEFQNRQNNYDDQEVCSSEFKEFVSALRQKFSAAAGDCTFEIPDTKEELFKRFKVYAIGEAPEENIKDTLASNEDIHSLVLNNLIQSTLVLSTAQMKSCRSFQTFHIYNRYKPDILFQAFLKCQRRGLVNRRRAHKIFGPKKNRALPFMPMSYQLSQTYYRCFTWRIPNTICSEAYQFLETLRSKGREDRPDTFAFQGPERGDSQLEVEAEPEPDPTMALFPLDASGGSCMASLTLMVLGLLSVDLSIPNQIVVVDSTMVDNEVIKSAGRDLAEDDDDDEVEEGEGKRKIEVKASQASHTNYLLMRGNSAPGIVSMRNLNTCDNVVVNSCTVRVKLRKTPTHMLFRPSCDSNVVDDLLQGEDCLPKGFTHLLKPRDDSCRLESFCDWCINQCNYSTDDLQAVLHISSAIEAALSVGYDKLELSRDFSTLEEAQEGRTRTFQQYLEDLVSLEEVIEVGGNSVRLVAAKYADPWLIQTCTTRRPAVKSKDLPLQEATPSKRSREQEEEEQELPKKRSLEQAEEEQSPKKKRGLEQVEEEEPLRKRSLEQAEEEQAPPRKRVAMATEGAETREQSRESDPDPSCPNPEAAIDTQRDGAAKREGQAQEGNQTQGAPVAENTSPEPSSPQPPSPTADSPAPSSQSTDATQTQPTEGECSSTIGSTSESVSFVSRPWRIVDGSLNRPVCKGMLESLLFHIMSKPGLPEPVLIEHYKGVLQPVVILELLQALEKMGCVLKRYIKACPRASLFSPAQCSEVLEKGGDFRDNATPFYVPTVDCCLRLAKVFPHEPNWNKWVPFIHS
ncbi:hypothetical protein AGOR_G00092120 [Albula goreensis]|uniref:B-block binding subunit of TFIIIC domain-containing protein n=1 Tax=Albula goreensis TaxID=1534307 RepID=A0A8T3DLF8_9TELE|nr:hypothetical protein AGOR_G00092120 [Albula goreensis]